MTLSKLIKELGIAAVPHGFRSSFRDWAAERTNTPREVVEAALAHTVRNPTEAAYARSDLFEHRRRLMDEWAATSAEPAGTWWHDAGHRRVLRVARLQATNRSDTVPTSAVGRRATPRPNRRDGRQSVTVTGTYDWLTWSIFGTD